MSDEWPMATCVAAVCLALIITVGVVASRGSRLSEESFRICVQAGQKAAECRGH